MRVWVNVVMMKSNDMNYCITHTLTLTSTLTVN